MKQCIACGQEKPLSEYYTHSRMGDGHLNKCRYCCLSQAKERYEEKTKDPVWVGQERERGREKYHRLGYKWPKDKEKERLRSERRRKQEPVRRKAHIASRYVPVPDGWHRHHWSYREADWKDIIPMSVADHATAHRFLVYDPPKRLFRTLRGTLLETRRQHETYIRFAISYANAVVSADEVSF